jgi:D-alanyl-D-alanine carboxypeptidase
MRSVRLVILFILLLFKFPISSQVLDLGSGLKEPSSFKDSIFSTLLVEYTKVNRLPGAIIGYKSYGQQANIKATGWSHVKQKVLMTDTTPFRCGSITKLFTAVIALQLIEEGRLALNDSMNAYFPEWTKKIRCAEKVTIEQLLNHTSGLGHPTEDNVRYRFRIALQPNYFYSLSFYQRFLKYAVKKPLRHYPGKDQYYSNAGYWVLAKIIEGIEGKGIDLIVNERIIEPLNLKYTYLSKKDEQTVSRGYTYFLKRLVEVTKWDRADSDGDPAAGLISTANDLLLFGEALFTNRLLAKSTLQLMTTIGQFPMCDPYCEFGLGIETWHTNSFQGYGKNGSLLGVDANLICFPEQKKTVVIFTNLGKGSDKWFIDNLVLY